MLIVPPIAFIRRAKAKTTTASPPPALALVGASYDPGAVPEPVLTLVFNRAIDISGFGGDAVEVDDGTFTNQMFLALGDATLTDPMTLRVVLAVQSGFGGTGVKLSAYDTNGIVAADDGSPWDGVMNLALPFP